MYFAPHLLGPQGHAINGDLYQRLDKSWCSLSSASAHANERRSSAAHSALLAS